MNLRKVSKKLKFKIFVQRVTLLIILVTVFILLLVLDLPDVVKVANIFVSGPIIVIHFIYTFVYSIFETFSRKYSINSKVISIEYGIIIKRKVEIPCLNIQDVGVYRNPFDILFRIGTITISTAGSNHKIQGINNKDLFVYLEEIRSNIVSRLEHNESIR